MTECVQNPFLFSPLFQLLLRPIDLSDSVVQFAAHHPYYKDKLMGNLIWSFICAANQLYFLFNLRNLLAVSLIAYNSDICIAKLGLVNKKEESPRTLIYFSNFFEFLYFLLSSIFSKMRQAIFKYFLISKCATISKQKFNSNLTSFFLLAYYPSIKQTGEKAIKVIADCKYLTSTKNWLDDSFDLFYIAQTVEFLSDNQASFNIRNY